MPRSSPSSGGGGGLRGPAQQVPMAEAKNNLSALVARVERGEEIAITRRGVPVVRLVPDQRAGEGMAGRRERVEAALGRLRQLGEGTALVGDLKAIAREGLDGEA
ncbi:MAG: type II toxin-antitoxin system prevent-host-death family antitoxin [Cyanobacteriota bacterium]|nr:type II toxin-antitoxin system prevent-host-death family antitoxin [Cyanobacteriota bacterium]